jgi:hypothetical protein
MKFMQRAAASTPSPALSTPVSEDNSKPNKRRKVAHAHESTLQQQNVDSLVDNAAIKAAIAEEEKKVEVALLRRAEESGDARWVLDVPEPAASRTTQTPLNVAYVGYAQIDNSPDDTESADHPHESVPAIRRFNMGKKKVRSCSHTQTYAAIFPVCSSLDANVNVGIKERSVFQQ